LHRNVVICIETVAATAAT